MFRNCEHIKILSSECAKGRSTQEGRDKALTSSKRGRICGRKGSNCGPRSLASGEGELQRKSNDGVIPPLTFCSLILVRLIIPSPPRLPPPRFHLLDVRWNEKNQATPAGGIS